MLRRFMLLVPGALLVFAVGCTDLKVGQRIDQGKIGEILPGRTTRDEVKEWFGNPLRASPDNTIYIYRFLDGKGRSEELVVSFASDDVVMTFASQ